MNGEYYTWDESGGSEYPAFCDFVSEPNSVWTLITSFSRGNIGKHKLSFKNDASVNEQKMNWEDYRYEFIHCHSLTTSLEVGGEGGRGKGEGGRGKGEGGRGEGQCTNRPFV